jgi:hypothetical protein
MVQEYRIIRTASLLLGWLLEDRQELGAYRAYATGHRIHATKVTDRRSEAWPEVPSTPDVDVGWYAQSTEEPKSVC